MSSEDLINGYKDLVAYFVKETSLGDDEVVDTLNGLLDEVNKVAHLGLHDLTDVEVTINHFKDILVKYN